MPDTPSEVTIRSSSGGGRQNNKNVHYKNNKNNNNNGNSNNDNNSNNKIKSKSTVVTSALPYANGEIHIGHITSTYLPADIFTRFCRLTGRKIYHVCAS